MRVAAVQMCSTPDFAANLAQADTLARRAAADGAQLVLLPEKWSCLGTRDDLAAGAQALDGPAVAWARATAAELAIDVVAGSIAEAVPGEERNANTSVHAGPDGEIRATYRKVHMFDVTVDGTRYEESAQEAPGSEIVVAEAANGVGLGLSVCYDLRFPELFRILALRGATAFTVPSAFTAVTGRDHWEVLLRARAIENASFVLAAGQVGKAEPHYESWGHSMLVGPWGQVLAEVSEGEGHACAALDLSELERVRASLPSLANRRGDAYEWPVEAPV